MNNEASSTSDDLIELTTKIGSAYMSKNYLAPLPYLS